MKRAITALLAALLLFTMSGCTGREITRIFEES